ncbi:MAG: hypothetical protein ACREIF_16140 [Chthoniobacterales bacterium]
MKTTHQSQELNPRHDANPHAERSGRSFPEIEQNYQCATLRGTCGTPAKFRGRLSFFRISDEYFAEEAPRNFLVETGVFAALILTALLPIANSVQAVATLIHHLGVL